MNRFALIGFYRSLVRHKLYAALNIGGLAVGIAVFLVLGLYVRFETSYETWLPNHGQIYLVRSQLDSFAGDNRLSENGPVAFWTAVSKDLPGTIGTRIYDADATVVKNGLGIRENLGLVDPDFSKVLAVPMVSGTLDHAFDDPTGIVLTQTAANKYFPGGDAIGKTLPVSTEGKVKLYRVTAIAHDLPANTDLHFDMLARLVIDQNPASPDYKSSHQWNYFNPWTYVRLPDAAAARRFQGQLGQVAARHAQSETADDQGIKVSFQIEPITDVHFNAKGRKLSDATLGLVGLLTLLIAIVNYVNLATARAGLRAREVAMRKVLGADRGTLARHYVGEAVATTALAGLLGLALSEIGLPLINAAAGISLKLEYFGADGVLLPLVVLVILVGFIAGLYPAIVLARFPAAAVLASSRSPGGGRAGTRVREGLVVAQFAIAIAFVIGTMVLYAQTRHVRGADVGYQREGLMLVPSLGNSSLNNAQRDAIIHRFAGLPGVSAVSVGNNAPGPGSFRSETQIKVPGVEGKGASLRFFQTTPGFFDVIGAHLLAGRLFSLDHPADINPDIGNDFVKPYNIVINRKALTALHIPSPQAAIGRTFVTPTSPTRTIVGVIDDMRFDDPRNPIAPTMYEFVPRDPDSAIAMLRFVGDPKAITEAAQAAWRAEAPEVPFQAKTAEQNLATYYRQDDHATNLFTIGAVLAVAIGCVGLWGLASFNTARRTREIGIRKTLGASSRDIVRLLVGQFLRPVLIANLFAWPLAFFAMRTWLAGFDDRIALSPLYFVAATVLALAIAVLTVLAQSLRAARAAPAWALRHD
ncbi:ABC transporter permease [Sphingomonas abietis]|uniref:ABC transporter permease n=1 Tax=Sphingomonas abietis TaxID=3012344 RepID=A0ABY7NL46_9SPHN|nr:ABC transporter permease [Sphingomonas abietis]WBO22219.1 ABC transporter permease [Sphingomonas abietis]